MWVLRQFDLVFEVAMGKITGRAKKFDGGAIDYVSIFNWIDGKCIAQITPKSSGNWSYTHDIDLKAGVTYIADGCEPITHGAYDFLGFCTACKLVYYSFDSVTPSVNDSALTLHGGASIDATSSKFGTGSLKISAENQYALTEVVPEISATDDFCIEFYAKTAKVGTVAFMDGRYGGNASGLSVHSIGGSTLGVYTHGAYLIPTTAVAYDATRWTHMALTRESGVFRVFINGVKKAEVDDTYSYPASKIMLGNNANAIDRYALGGNIDEFMVSKGDARYVRDFTPPTKSFY